MWRAHAVLAADQVCDQLHRCQAEAAFHVGRQHFPQSAKGHALLHVIPAAMLLGDQSTASTGQTKKMQSFGTCSACIPV